jgi:hypothetical protein
MNKIEIEIPDNLSPSQEAVLIAKKMMQAQKKLGTRGQKLIGNSLELVHLETQITIKRVTTEKPEKTFVCSVCGTTCSMKLSVPLFHNYGGYRKRNNYCTSECRDFVASFLGIGRGNKEKKEVKHALLIR